MYVEEGKEAEREEGTGSIFFNMVML